ncbi:elastase-1-like [Saccoglossus kowalevskii]|uniref:Elastase 1/2-like protein n=1 Tax=Saccoglossus kowalevskii TaxID=10224 RepID=A0A1C9TA42_SACKO|nr:PREDICTED: ovochymase-1-like [Saccoglossus kowalevskii]AOR07004.1 elastase 1/2-like protein [Saccoglossus kowalevskii]
MDIFYIFTLCISAQFIEVYGQLNPTPRKDAEVDLSTRIVGGQEAAPHAYPWQAYLIKRLQGNWRFTCGGMLIDREFVLTAAHCIEGVSKRNLQVVLGDHDITVTEGTERFHEIKSILINPDYDPYTFDGDFALLRLKNAATLNSYVDVVTLADTFNDSGECVITGWGNAIKDGPQFTVLQEAAVTIVPVSTCESIWNSFNPITDTMMCAGNGAQGSCEGDSGGPMVCFENGVWVAHGITSWGTEQCGVDGIPDVYARISSIHAQIMSIISGGGGGGGGGNGNGGNGNGNGNGNGKGKG